jgi:uncharacterized membrane protein HdeD (DUF308 family)
MKQSEQSQQAGHFLAHRGSILLRGIIMTVAGLFLCLVTASQVQVNIMPPLAAGWLPLLAIILVIVGFLEGVDAFRARRNREFFITLQLAILDTVTGIMLLFEMSNRLDNLYLLVAAYLLYKGLFRIIAALNINFPQARLTVLGGFFSVVLGIMLWQEWPVNELWFLSFCLSFDITTRGYSLTRFALWLSSLAKTNKNDIRSLL